MYLWIPLSLSPNFCTLVIGHISFCDFDFPFFAIFHFFFSTHTLASQRNPRCGGDQLQQMSRRRGQPGMGSVLLASQLLQMGLDKVRPLIKKKITECLELSTMRILYWIS